MAQNKKATGGQLIGAASQRLTEIDVAKGLAIVLVVFGHIVAQEPPADNNWYILAKQSLYKFHMAFFMFLSGIVFFRKVRLAASLREYGDQIWRRFVRLMPAYFLFAGFVFLAKWGAQHFLHVDNPVSGWSDLVGILLFPMQSISAFLWYIYVLFLYCSVGLALMSLTGGRILVLVILGVMLLFAPRTPFLGMDQFCKYFLFFALGGLAICHWDRYSDLVDWIWLPVTTGFIFMLGKTDYRGEGYITITALLSLIALHGLCKHQGPFTDILEFLGLMSFPIYLMNTLSIGFVKAIMLKFVSWDGVNFLFFVPILTLAGLWIPVMVKQYLFRRIGWLDNISS